MSKLLDNVMTKLRLMSLVMVCISLFHNIDHGWSNPYVPWVNGKPSTSQLEALPPTPIRPKMSYQTRISQSELPILEGLVYSLTVKYVELNDGSDCEEKFQNVRILDSVLNLELGQNAACDFISKVSVKKSLDMKLCFTHEAPQTNSGITEANADSDNASSSDSAEANEASDNGSNLGSSGSTSDSVAEEIRCFNRSVKISSVPYAIKVNIAKEAESVYQSNLSFLSVYAYRVTDTSVLSNAYNVPSYLSFETKPPSGLGLAAMRLDSSDTNAIAEISNAGYVRWHAQSSTADNQGADEFYLAQSPFNFLDQLTFVSRLVDWYGPQAPIEIVRNYESVQSTFEEDTALVIQGNMETKGHVTVDRSLLLVDQNIQIEQNLTIAAGGLNVDGASDMKQNLNITGSLQQGWQNNNLVNSVPNYLFSVLGPLRFIGPLEVKPLSSDKSSQFTVSNTSVAGTASFNMLATANQASTMAVRGNTTVKGQLKVDQGRLSIDQNLSVSGDGEIHQNLEIGQSFSLMREGSIQPVMHLVGETSSSTLAINFDPTEGQDLASPYYDEIYFKGKVQFADQVTFDSNVDVEPECQITPARITDPNSPNFGKLIPEVFDLDCGGVQIRVSALLESDCGNGIREGEEICDDGEGNLIDPVNKYCDLSTTPYENCRFYRLVSWPRADCEAPADGIHSIEVDDLGTVSYRAIWFISEDYPNGRCALQSDQDEERDVYSLCPPSDQGCADPSPAVVSYPSQVCRADCTYARCGDGIVDPLQIDASETGLLKEQCDDGNLIDNDDCSNLCQFVSSCKLDVADRLNSQSALVEVDTTSPARSSFADSSEEARFYSDAECAINQSVRNYPNAPQRAVEVDIDEPTMLAFQTYTYTINPNIAHQDPFIYYRQACDQVRSEICDDDSGVNRMSALAPRLYQPGRHYIVVGGYDESQGKTYLGVKFTCNDPQKLLASIHHKSEDSEKSLIFQPNTANQGGVGHVQTNCLNTVPNDFVQPTSSEFNADEAETGLGLHQVAIELILESESDISINARSSSIDPVVYIKSGCETTSTLRDPDNPSQLLCNDNVTNNSPEAQLEQRLPSGIYYIIIDDYSSSGGPLNIALDIQ